MEPRFVRGESRRASWTTRTIAVAASLLVHLSALLLWRVAPPVTLAAERSDTALPETIRFVLSPIPPTRKPRVPPRATVAQPASPAVAPAQSTAAEPPRDTSTVSPEAPAKVSAAPLAHGFGDGRLWVSPLTSQELELTHRLKKGYAEQADSAEKVMIQAYLDSMAAQLARGPRPPSWVGEIGGKKFGVNSRFVYVAGLKIPTFLLALLPLPAGGNQALALDHNRGLMYDDLRRAAVRSANLEEFKDAIKALREQSEFQHQLNAEQREGSSPEEGPVAGSSP